jgi:uncharacterized damage-inducible protein DinB
MDLLTHFRTQVRANRLANHRLHGIMTQLSVAEHRAPRTGFFPGLAATFEHILLVDRYCLDCLHSDADDRQKALAWSTPASLAALVEEQARSDHRFARLIDRADDTVLAQIIELPRSTPVQREPMANVLDHRLNHQAHHRGQAHAMLSDQRVVS